MLSFLRDVMIVVAALAMLIALAFYPSQDSEVGHAGRTHDTRAHRPPVTPTEVPVGGQVPTPGITLPHP